VVLLPEQEQLSELDRALSFARVSVWSRTASRPCLLPRSSSPLVLAEQRLAE